MYEEMEAFLRSRDCSTYVLGYGDGLWTGGGWKVVKHRQS